MKINFFNPVKVNKPSKLFSSFKKPKQNVMNTIKGITKKNMNWIQAKTKYPQLNPYGDADGDKIINMYDCHPFDKRRQEEIPFWKKQKIAAQISGKPKKVQEQMIREFEKAESKLRVEANKNINTSNRRYGGDISADDISSRDMSLTPEEQIAIRKQEAIDSGAISGAMQHTSMKEHKEYEQAMKEDYLTRLKNRQAEENAIRAANLQLMVKGTPEKPTIELTQTIQRKKVNPNYKITYAPRPEYSYKTRVFEKYKPMLPANKMVEVNKIIEEHKRNLALQQAKVKAVGLNTTNITPSSRSGYLLEGRQKAESRFAELQRQAGGDFNKNVDYEDSEYVVPHRKVFKSDSEYYSRVSSSKGKGDRGRTFF